MRFPFISPATHQGKGTLMPFLPITLRLKERKVQTHGLLDTGAAINVLPFSMGLDLGAVWQEQKMPVKLGGILSSAEAHILFVDTIIEGCQPTQLAFAWTSVNNVPLLLGQTNFFMEFDVLFSRSALFFEVSPKETYL